ncbi:polysaccharide pyruvyl transferase family protein [Mariniphaga sediminis]|uniref:Polysaccharide pyruvyl transferase family protein n=1 Tax=Mariniphaga sediminis TaxID=1628158 RepID=A0A399D811_9BACT|nr:polysaccharide pyruvyl transferase family protein [Mariniphaga sediminis]RIH67188.1 polysaccharide pyruvyl transferase family protein [Mariniphaga sediminis]
MHRRQYLRTIALSLGGLACTHNIFAKSLYSNNKKKTILLVSGRQFSNIGDVGHVTGILNLLNIYLPEAKIILWPRISKIDDFDNLIHKFWPDVQIIHSKLRDKNGKIDNRNGLPDNEDVYRAAEAADLFIAGSGGGIMEGARWLAENYKKPYGAYGVTIEYNPTGAIKKMLDEASFIFTRDTSSLEFLKNTRCKEIGFAPDSTFASTIEDDIKASQFMSENGLEYKKFICVVPRLRKTPYYKIPPSLRSFSEPWTDEKIEEVDTLNNKYKEQDHAKVREAMITWIRRTGNQVLLCPEMIHNMDLYNELLYDPLPDDVKKKVVKKEDFWKTDEATTVYKNATAVISLECHSPILALGQGTPAFYVRQPEDTIKGQMYYDIGLADWVFEIEETKGEDISNRLMEVYNDYSGAKLKVEAAMDYVRKVQWDTMSFIRKQIGLA